MSNDASPYGDMMHLLRKYDVAPLRSAMIRCLPLCAVRHTSLGVADIIGRSPASFAEGKHHSKNALLSVDKSAFFVAWDGWIRTSEMTESKSVALPLGYTPIYFITGI